MSNFSLVVTLAGKAADQASKLPGASAIQFSRILIGDGNNAPVTVNETQTALVRLKASIPVESVTADAVDPTLLWIVGTYIDVAGEAALPLGYTINEIGLTITGGSLYAVAACPATYLPMPSEGGAREMRFRLPLKLGASTGIIQIVSNPSAYATQQWVQTLIAGIALPTVPNPASVPEHLAGTIDYKWAHPKGVMAMLNAMKDFIVGLIPPALVFDATLPGAGTNADPKKARLASKNTTGIGRGATQGEANAGTGSVGGVLPFVTPDVLLNLDMAEPVGAHLRPPIADYAIIGSGRAATQAEVNAGQAAANSYYLPWLSPWHLRTLDPGSVMADALRKLMGGYRTLQWYNGGAFNTAGNQWDVWEVDMNGYDYFDLGIYVHAANVPSQQCRIRTPGLTPYGAIGDMLIVNTGTFGKQGADGSWTIWQPGELNTPHDQPVAVSNVWLPENKLKFCAVGDFPSNGGINIIVRSRRQW